VLIEGGQYLSAMIQPLDEHMPTPDEIDAAMQRTGLWFHDLYAGYDWSVSTAYDQWVELALRMGWIDCDPLDPASLIPPSDISRQIASVSA